MRRSAVNRFEETNEVKFGKARLARDVCEVDVRGKGVVNKQLRTDNAAVKILFRICIHGFGEKLSYFSFTGGCFRTKTPSNSGATSTSRPLASLFQTKFC